jgi:hypothetical protein
MRGFVSRPQLATWLYAAGALAIGCSFQEFDYLQDGGTISSPGGAASGGSHATQGGTKPNGGSGAGEPSGAGTATTAGKGGQPTQHPEAGDTGNPDVGGAGGAGGADGTGGTGATGELVNPSFETFNTVGWTVEPAGSYAFVQLPQGTDKNPHGAYEFSTWSETKAYAVELYQKIKGLEDGTYTFQAYIASGQNKVSMFARHCGGATDPEPVVVPIQAWTPVQVKDIEVVGGSCEVGLHIESQPKEWMNADLFTFEKDAE